MLKGISSGDQTITIFDFATADVESLLKYFYYDCIAIEDINENLLVIAHQYKAKKLFMICERFLAETLHSLDITKTLSAASKVGSKIILKSGKFQFFHFIIASLTRF